MLPSEPSKTRGDRRRCDDRLALAGIIFVLRSGIPWQMPGPFPVLFRSSESDAHQEGDWIWQRHAARSSSGMRCASR
ncbi:hypothetical protein H5394_15945 [Paracoccus sp. MC1862]|nr:hypothetical protein [Paracoccus sp. MC1862]QQO46335.1 hypothetical protein JGR78_05475 [Paracoccus sp. MC1862]